jgi:hypothetical protein
MLFAVRNCEADAPATTTMIAGAPKIETDRGIAAKAEDREQARTFDDACPGSIGR